MEDFSLGLERRFTVNYKVFDNTQLNYSKNIRSDMSEYREEVLNKLKVGSLTNLNESLNYSFGPQWVSWFKPNFSYNTNYTWNKPLNSVIDAANLNLVKNTAINLLFPRQKLLKLSIHLFPRDNRSHLQEQDREDFLALILKKIKIKKPKKILLKRKIHQRLIVSF